MKNVAVLTEDGAFALFFRPHPGGFDSSRVPTPGNLPSKAQKNANAWGLAHTGWAQVELTGALARSIWRLCHTVWHFFLQTQDFVWRQGYRTLQSFAKLLLQHIGILTLIHFLIYFFKHCCRMEFTMKILVMESQREWNPKLYHLKRQEKRQLLMV